LKGAGFNGWVSIEDGVNGLDELQQSVAFLRRKLKEYFG
jgi:sugar phosphate isomerase/epimerase